MLKKYDFNEYDGRLRLRYLISLRANALGSLEDALMNARRDINSEVYCTGKVFESEILPVYRDPWVAILENEIVVQASYEVNVYFPNFNVIKPLLARLTKYTPW